MALWEEAMRLETAAEAAGFRASKSETPANVEAYKDASQLAKKAWPTAAEAREAAANKSVNERDKNLLLADVTTAEEKADDWGRALKEAQAETAEAKLGADAQINEVKRAAEAKAVADAKAFEERLARETREAAAKARREGEKELRRKQELDKQAADRAAAHGKIAAAKAAEGGVAIAEGVKTSGGGPLVEVRGEQLSAAAQESIRREVAIIKEGVAAIKALEALPCGDTYADKRARAQEVLRVIRERMWPTFSRALEEFRGNPNEERLAMAPGAACAYRSGTAIGSAFTRNGEESSKAAEASDAIAKANQTTTDHARGNVYQDARTQQDLEWLALTAREESLFAQRVEEYQRRQDAEREKPEWKRGSEPAQAAFQEARSEKREERGLMEGGKKSSRECSDELQ